MTQTSIKVRRLPRIALALTAGAVLCAVALYWLTQLLGDDLDSRLDQLRAAGAPTTIRELAPGDIPAERDAAVSLRKLEEPLRSFSRDYHDFANTEAGKALLALREQNQLPTPGQIAAVEALLGAHRKLAEDLRAAAAQPQYGSQLDYSLNHPAFLNQMMNDLAPMRSAARLLRLQVDASLVRGDPDTATAVAVDLLRLTRHLEREPAIISYLVAIACRQIACNGLNHAIRQENVSDKLRAELDAELQPQRGMDSLQKALAAERVLGLEGLAAANPGGAPNILMGWQIGKMQASLLDYYETMLPIAAQPWHLGRSQLNSNANITSGVVQQLLPAIQSCYDAAWRDIAIQRCLRTLNEIQRYKVLHDAEPDGLSDLQLPASETTDPFTGNPLTAQQTSSGWIVYSYYLNRKDDGGTFKDLLDCGLAP